MSVLRSRLPATLRSAQAPRLASARRYSTPPKPSAPVSTHQPTSSTPKEIQQSPNVAETWSTSQNPKPFAFDNPRFEQTALQFQPNAPSAMGMVAEDPIRLVTGGGPLGHPKIFINLDKPGPKACGYCGIRYEQAHHTH